MTAEIEALRAALAAARAESEAKSRLISHTSHEIRTNLAGVLGLAQAARETRLTPEQHEFFELIAASGDAILTLVNDLLDLSKMEAGMLGIESISFDLMHTLDDVAATFKAPFQEKGLTLEMEKDPSLPARVSGDPGRLRQILVNLLANAVRFTDTGGATIEVSLIERTQDGVLVEVAVVDTGVGIPPDRQDAIFAPYAQADPGVARQRGGSGLGLSIARQLAELMGGSLTVDSVVGEGSRFSLRLPLVEALHVTVPTDVGVRAAISELPMLVISERPETLSAAIAGLEAQVDTATTDEGIEKRLAAAIDQPYALIAIERSDALELAAELRTRNGLDTTHILILTATGQRGDAARCRELRIGGYLTAPYAPIDVATAVSEVIAGPAPFDLTVLVTRHWLRERRRRLSILVVDDSPTLRMTSSRLLERRGHSVRTVGGGDAAIDAVRTHRYDAIVMDINMPGMDGYEATARIRSSEFGDEVPIIAVSSQADEVVEARVIAAGASELLSRPFEVFELVAAIERAIVDDHA